MKTKIIYHEDLDGITSAFIAQKKFPDAEMVSIEHDMDRKEKLVKEVLKEKYDRIVLLDFSFDDEVMQQFYDMTKEFIWIDHHKSAAKSKFWDAEIVLGKRCIVHAACILTCTYFYPRAEGDIYYEIPLPIQYIGDMDMWQFKYGDDTRAFCEYLAQYDINDDFNILKSYIIDTNPDITKLLIQKGMKLLTYKQARIKKLYKKGHIEDFEGHKCFKCNSPMFQSDLADYTFEHRPDIDIALIHQTIWNGTKWTKLYSIYSRGKVDVSKIAKNHGGGGHHNASGFEERPV